MVAPTDPRHDLLSIREAANRLLARRPDLASHRQQRRRARQIADSVGMRAASVDVLAGWLGSNGDADVRDLEVALEDRVKLRLAALSPRDREAADGPRFRARVALGLGWEQLPPEGPREALRVLALVGGQPTPRELVEEAAGGTHADTSDLVWSGFAQLADESNLLRAHGDVLDHLASQTEPKPAARTRPLRFILAVRNRLLADPSDDLRSEEAAEHACRIAERHQQPALVASVAHRVAERMRRRGDFEGAARWIDRGLAAADKPNATPMRGLLEMDQGLLALQHSDLAKARACFERAVTALEMASLADVPGSDEAIERARLMHGEALAATGELSRAEGEIAEVVRGLQRRWNEGLEPDAGDVGGVARRRSLAAGLAHGFRALGTVRLLRGDVSGALIHLQEAREDWLELAGEDDADGAAFALALARGLRSAGRFNEVEEPLEAARVLAGGDMDRLARPELPIALHDLGVSGADRGEVAAAATLLDEATMLAGSLLPKKHPLRARILYTRALMFLADADLSRAIDHLDEAGGYELDAAARALLDGARAWAVAQEGAHRHLEMGAALMEAHQALADQRGADSAGAAHLRLLAKSLG